MNYKKGIDFTLATYALRLPWMREYTKILVDSIHKFTTDVPYKIYIVYNYITDECAESNEVLQSFTDGLSEKEALEQMFGDDDRVVLVKGVDQSSTVVIHPEGRWYQESGIFPGKIDKLISENLINKKNNQIKLSDKGKLLGNEVFINFL